MIKPYYEDLKSGITIYHGDNQVVMSKFRDSFFDSVITDPPYSLNFMNKEWDSCIPGKDLWEAVLRVCKPGAMLLAFGGTRTQHRLTCAIEDAGWTIRDCLMWLYGSGFPKSLDISKAIDKAKGASREILQSRFKNGDMRGVQNFGNHNQSGKKVECNITAPSTDVAKQWDGWGTALKPAWEPIIIAMKPLDGTFAENAEKHGVAGLNIDGGRIAGRAEKPFGTRKDRTNDSTFPVVANRNDNPEEWEPSKHGRWPANLLLDEEVAGILDEETRDSIHGAGSTRPPGMSKFGESRSMFNLGGHESNGARIGDDGGVSRFFYIAKSSNDDRGNKDELDMPLFNTKDPGLKNIHPTVKPLELMEKLILLQTYLCKLTSTPTGGLILDPFLGSGSTLIAAKRCGRPAIGIEKEEAYAEVAAKRLEMEPTSLCA